MGVKWNSPGGRAVARALGLKPETVEDRAAAAVAEWAGRNGLPFPVRQHRFHPRRKWLLDLAWPSLLVGLELDGGTYSAGRFSHSRPGGQENDREKANEAALLGWLVVRATYRQFHKGMVFDWLKRAFEIRGRR